MINGSGIRFCNSNFRLNGLLTEVASDKQNGETKITTSCKNAVFDLLCFCKFNQIRRNNNQQSSKL